jgi:hypothetical protein
LRACDVAAVSERGFAVGWPPLFTANCQSALWFGRSVVQSNPDTTVVGNCAALAVSAPVITKDADIFQLGPSLELGHALLKVLELFQIRQRRNSKAADRARGRFGRDKLLAKT